jgi:hypothetical protein
MRQRQYEDSLRRRTVVGALLSWGGSRTVRSLRPEQSHPPESILHVNPSFGVSGLQSCIGPEDVPRTGADPDAARLHQRFRHGLS